MADTLSELLSNVASFKKGSEIATTQAIQLLGQQSAKSAEITDIFKQQATDDAAVASAKLAAEMETQLSRTKAANALGTNLKDSTEVVTALAQDAAIAYENKRMALNSYREKEAINFLDDPLGYVKAQLLIHRDISAHNVANAQLQQAETRLASINQLTQTTVQTQNAIAEPLTAASVAAATRNAAVVANVNAKKSEIDTLSYSTAAIDRALNSSKEVLSVEFQAQGAKNAARSLQLSEENAAQNRIEFSYRQAEYQDRMADKKAQDDLGKSVVDTVELGRKALMGSKYVPMDDMSGKMVIGALKSKGTLSAETQVYYEAGQRSRFEGKVMIGATPAKAATTIMAVPIELNPTQVPIKNLLSQANSDLAAGIDQAARGGKDINPVFAGVNPKDKTSVDKAFNGRAQQLLNSYGAEVKPSDPANPYQIASVNQLYTNSPTVRNLPVVKKVFEPLMKTGVQLTDPKQIVFLVGEALAKGKITHNEALELSTVYHVGVSANMAMRNFEGFGLQPSNKYNARVEINPNAFQSTEVIDLTKPEQLSRALMKMQAGALYAGARGQRASETRRNPIFDDRGVAPDSMFQPNPAAANRLDAAADAVAPAVTNFFKNLPKASDFEDRPERRRVSGQITPQRK